MKNLSSKIKNSKDFLQFLFKQMNELEAGRINIDEAKAHALLAKQVNNIYKAEFERAGRLTCGLAPDFGSRTQNELEMRKQEPEV